MLAKCTQKIFDIVLWKCECYYAWVLVNKWWKEIVFARYLEIDSIYSIQKDGLLQKTLNFVQLTYTLGFKKILLSKIPSYL